MIDVFATFCALIGGLGLFLLAIGMMTDGLQQSAGHSLRNILANSTDTPIKGILSGFSMTALVQSSSAVTVTSIGFVNAGLLTMQQALGVVYGANIGTTITGWLVAFVGFKIDIQAFSLPLIGIGMGLQLIKREGRLASFGFALAGFGVFFLGIDVLKNAFESIVATFDLAKISSEGISQVFIFLSIGIVMTVLTQSSSAAIALIITAAVTEVIEIDAAAAMVIGANVGTTSTAVLASIGATANAKRVALAQVIFNVGTAIVALLIMPLMFAIISALSQFLSMSAEPGISLALFHTVFNVLGVILIFPLNKQLVHYLERKFISREHEVYLPKFLDQTLTATPVLAVNALVMEFNVVEKQVNNVLVKTADMKSSVSHQELHTIRALSMAISKFISTIERNKLLEETADHLSSLISIDQRFLACIKSVVFIIEKKAILSAVTNQEINKTFNNYQTVILDVLTAHTSKESENTQTLILNKFENVKRIILKEATQGHLDFEVMLDCIDIAEEMLKMTQLWQSAYDHLQQLNEKTDVSLLKQNEEDLVPLIG